MNCAQKLLKEQYPLPTDEQDYRGLTAYRLVFPYADTTRKQCIDIPILDDVLVESTERFFVNLQSDPRMPTSMLIGQNSTASVTITDNDTPGMSIFYTVRVGDDTVCGFQCRCNLQ